MVEDNTNSVEICRLEFTPPDVRIKTVCFLELPPLKQNAFLSVSRTEKEWVSTSKHHPRPDSVRRRPVPFRSSKVGSIRFALDYHILSEGAYSNYPYTMVVSVAELLSNVRTDRRSVPWTDWGPACTRIFPRQRQMFPPRPAGPSWINHYSQGEQWVGGAVETCLPYRDFIIHNLHFNSPQQVIADREWLVDVSVR